MRFERSDVYVPRAPSATAPGGAPRAAGETAPWPPTIYRPELEEEDRALSRRVEGALGGGLGGVRAGDRHGAVADVFRDPGLADSVVDRMAREARDRGCSAVAAVGTGGLLVGAPVAVRASLPLVVVRPGRGRDDGPAWEAGEPGRGRGRPGRGPSLEADLGGAGDRVLVVDDVAGSGATLAAAAAAVEEAGGEVASLGVVVETETGDARGRLSEYNLFSIITL